MSFGHYFKIAGAAVVAGAAVAETVTMVKTIIDEIIKEQEEREKKEKCSILEKA